MAADPSIFAAIHARTVPKTCQPRKAKIVPKKRIATMAKPLRLGLAWLESTVGTDRLFAPAGSRLRITPIIRATPVCHIRNSE
jgi:hypothetical protein